VVNLLHIAAVVATGVAAFTDLRTGEMPNRVTLGALGLGLVGGACMPLFHGGTAAAIPGALGTAVLGAVVASVVPLFLWRGRALGGGDVKLFCALGALMGPMLALEAQMMAFAAGALIIPFRLAWQGRLFATLGRSVGLVTNAFVPADRKKPIDAAAMTWFRLGPAIFAGTVLCLALRGGFSQ